MPRQNRLLSSERKHFLVRTMVRLCDVSKQAPYIPIDCTRTQHGQLRSTMHLVHAAGVRDDRLWRLWTNLFAHVRLTMRPLPSSRSEPDPVRAPLNPGLVPRDLQ